MSGAPSTYPSQSEADTTQPAAALSFCATPPLFGTPTKKMPRPICVFWLEVSPRDSGRATRGLLRPARTQFLALGLRSRLSLIATPRRLGTLLRPEKARRR